MQFNRLLIELDRLVETGEITEKIFAQTGASDYKPKHFEYKEFINRGEYAAMTKLCDVFITHGGTGAIIGAVRQGKKVVAMPRLAKYGEHVDDHQLQLLNAFSKLGIIEFCEDETKLGEAIKNARVKEYKEFKSNTSVIVEDIKNYLG